MPPKTPPKPRRDLGELLLDRGSDGLPLRLVAAKDDPSLKDLTASPEGVDGGAELAAQGGLGAAALGRERGHRRSAARHRRRGLGDAIPAASRCIAGGAARRRLPLRRQAPRSRARRSCLACRLLSLRPLQERGERQAEAPGAARGRRPGPCPRFGRGALSRPRPHQHAGQRPRPGGARSRGAGACDRAWRRDQGHRRLEPLVRQFSHDPRRRPGQRPGAAPDRPPLGLERMRPR